MLNKSHTKYIQSLHHKKFRDELGCFIAEGPKVVLELLLSRAFACTYIFALENWMKENEKILQNHAGPELITVKDFELEKLSALTNANNAVAVFKKKTERLLLPKSKITLVLDAIQDPGNFGTIIRTADWFGVDDVVCTANCADMYNTKVVQSTMGSLARINVVYTDVENWLRKNTAIKKLAAALNGTSLKSIGKVNEAIIIIGNEGKGINDNLMQLADDKITIEKIGEAESLNAGVATGVILAAIC
jgi:RNA methyltransferase, TrmH family